MNAQEILASLKKLGKPQTAAIYKRHGSGENVFGVLTSDVAKLQKKVKTDHALALELWRTGNAEARILALLIADPRKMTRADLDRLFEGGQMSFLGCYVAALAAKSPAADTAMRAWMKSTDEWKREIGYGILSARLKDDASSIPDADAAKALATIEKEIHGSANKARHAMNGALIAIGTFKGSLRERAVAAAKRIGKVTVDHGETSCKTPDAAAYIAKASKRRLCP